MRTIISTASLLLALLPATLQAQIKLPVYDPAKDRLKNVTYQEASEASDYKHGNLVRITMNGAAQNVDGILVRTDASKGIVYVRTQPGAAPRAIPISDIKRVDKGIIRQVDFAETVRQPEIQELVIYNGGKRTVTYRAPNLSPGELSQLGTLEEAENEYARLDRQRIFEEQAVDDEAAIRAEHKRTLVLANLLLAQQLYPYPWSGAYWYLPRDGEYMLPYGPYTPDGFNGPGTKGRAVEGALAISLIERLPRIDAAATVKTITVTPAAIGAAQKKLQAAQARAVYENGQLVAMIADDSK